MPTEVFLSLTTYIENIQKYSENKHLEKGNMNSTTAGKWAVTMFSLTNEIMARTHTPNALLEQVLEKGLTDVVELDGPQHFRNYPQVAESEISELMGILAKNNASVAQLGIYIDRTLAPGKSLTHEQVINHVHQQLKLAAQIGVKFARLGLGFASIDELREIVPLAEALGVTLVLEAQGTQTIESSPVAENLDLMRELNSPHFGLLFDLSLAMVTLPPTYLKALQDSGFTADEVSQLKELWDTKETAELKPIIFGQWLPKAPSHFATSLLLSLVTRMGKSRISDWAEAMPLVKGVHLKFWDTDDGQSAISGPTRELLTELEKQGFDGYLISEWGGHEWHNAGVDSFEVTKLHKQLVALT